MWHPLRQVVAVVKSAVEGSEEALGQLQKGAGAGSYKSAIKAEVWQRESVTRRAVRSNENF